MAVVDSVRKKTRISRERLLARYKEKAFGKVLYKILRAARRGEESIEVDLDNLFFRSFDFDFSVLLKNIIIDAFRKDGFYVKTNTINILNPKITISWRPRNE